MTDRCGECKFDWGTSTLEGLRIISRLPLQSRQVIEPMEDDVYFKPETGGWSANEYVWHLADTFRMGAEWLHDIRTREHPTHYAIDNDALAAARGYARLPVMLGLWSLAQACDAFIGEAAPADPDRTCYYHDWQDVTAGQVVSFLVHEAVHHLYDLHRLATREEIYAD